MNAATNISRHPILSRGSSGESVKELQQLLKSYNYKISVDGVFGIGTEAAVKDFQTSFGLTADGVVGRKTWQALYAGYGG